MIVNNSSNISEIDHDSGGLLVTFRNGRKYRYPNVDGDTYGQLCDAVYASVTEDVSVGKVFNRLVRSVHQGVEVFE